MKKLITIAASCMLVFAAGLRAQECNTYFPMKEGTTFEIHSFNGTGKLEGSSTHKVIKSTISTGHVESTVHMSKYDEKKKEHIGEQEYTVKCKNGNYFVDMRSIITQEQLKSMKGFDVRINSDTLDIPSQPRVGQQLRDGKLTIDVENDGIAIVSMHSNVTNRKIEAIETITTPAGTFECIKITYDIQYKMVFKSSGRAEEWYALGVGLVQSKTYDGKGKQQSFQQLVKITQP